VYYFSRKTNPAERNYTSYELEALAVVQALEKFRHYLLGIKFKIVTDCAALKQTIDKAKPCPKIARWIMTLEEYDKVIEHRSGSRMRHVDALSRYPVMSIIENSIIVKIKEAQKNDSELKAIMEILEHKAYEDYLLRKGVLYKYKDGPELLVLPKSMHNEVIQMAHNKGHFSVKCTEENQKNDYYIPKLREKIERFISNCVYCILANKKEGKQEGFLNPLEKADLPLYVYHINHLGPLESTHKNYNHIFIVIDNFTKFV